MPLMRYLTPYHGCDDLGPMVGAVAIKGMVACLSLQLDTRFGQ
jgi:hypothetical protein